MKKATYIFILTLVFSTQLMSQKTRVRLTTGINFKFNSKTSINASIQNAFRTELTKIYSEYAFGLNYRLTDNLYIRPSVNYLYLGNLDDVKAYKVWGLRLSKRVFKDKYIRLYGRIKMEYHSKNQYRYRARVIPSLVLRSKRFKIDDRVRLNINAFASPYIIFGGNEISQYDGEEEYMGEYSPAGIKRLRLGTGASLKYGNVIVSASYMIQREFNLFEKSKYNISQKSYKTGKINHKYRDYNAINLSINYILNWSDIKSISDIQEEL